MILLFILLSQSEGYCQLFPFIDYQTVVISLHQSFCSEWKKSLVNNKTPHFDSLLFGVVTVNGRAGRAQSSALGLGYTDCVPSIFGGCIRLILIARCILL